MTAPIMHSGVQDIKTTVIDLTNTTNWFKFTPKIPAGVMKKIRVVNNGVSDDKATDVLIEVQAYQGSFNVSGNSFPLKAVGSNFEDVSKDPDVKYAFKSGTDHGTVYIQEIEILPTPVFVTNPQSIDD